RLSPVERAVFVLREAFGYAHGEIAEMLQLSEANSQQLYSRARRRVCGARPPPHHGTAQRRVSARQMPKGAA
uniref:sigma factor-like helix-turn-helix DNA-binding protein n=1 Tax=Nocardia wallacei TaxID=480035 RepID=UPI003CC7EEE6